MESAKALSTFLSIGGTNMKTILAILLGVVLSLGAYAEPRQHGKSELAAEISGILDRNASAQLATMTVGDVEKLMGEISIAGQKAAYVQHARMASFLLPGVGQLITGDPVGGALFLAGDAAVFAGSVLGAYYLLPANIRIGTGSGTDANGMDYLNTPVANIKTAWGSNSALAYLPSVGVMAGGMLLRGVLGWWSSAGAVDLAKRNIADGKVTFQPELVPDGMGMMMRWRY
jgi:hypothetical protein